MFANVRTKFFTHGEGYENKAATRMTAEQEDVMARDIKSVIERSAETLISDAIGAACLMVMLVIGLSLTGYV